MPPKAQTSGRASKKSRKRQTTNSIRAGQLPGLPSSSRLDLNDPIVQRVTSRISASRLNSVDRNLQREQSDLSNMSDIPENNQLAGPVNKRMPKPGVKNTPSFDPEKPEELNRFFERMEDWFLEDSLVDQDKKKTIVKYLDAESETQWKALSKFRDGTGRVQGTSDEVIPKSGRSDERINDRVEEKIEETRPHSGR